VPNASSRAEAARIHADEVHGYHARITYLPTSRFWPVQGVEWGLFLVLALALMTFTFWWVTTREVSPESRTSCVLIATILSGLTRQSVRSARKATPAVELDRSRRRSATAEGVHAGPLSAQFGCSLEHRIARAHGAPDVQGEATVA